ncbi:MAG: hypothetical protein N3B21_01120 [Clostridia bacterium]|nr:hypothetical protein [Clostridia bacterium]
MIVYFKRIHKLLTGSTDLYKALKVLHHAVYMFNFLKYCPAERNRFML